MSALGDALATKNKEAVSASRIEISVDSVATNETVTFSIRLEAPSFNEVVLTAQTEENVIDAVAEYQLWATTLWS